MVVSLTLSVYYRYNVISPPPSVHETEVVESKGLGLTVK